VTFKGFSLILRAGIQ